MIEALVALALVAAYVFVRRRGPRTLLAQVTQVLLGAAVLLLASHDIIGASTPVFVLKAAAVVVLIAGSLAPRRATR